MNFLSEKELKTAAAKGLVKPSVLKKPLPPDLQKLLVDAIAAFNKRPQQSAATVDLTPTNRALTALLEAINRIKVGAPPPQPYTPPDYEFTIHRDMNGRIESVSAHAVPAK